MKTLVAGIVGTLMLAGCATGPVTDAAVALPPGTSARLELMGPGRLSIQNDGSAPLLVSAFSGGAAQGQEVELAAAAKHRWKTDGPSEFRVSNRSAVSIPFSYRVTGTSVSFRRSDAKR